VLSSIGAGAGGMSVATLLNRLIAGGGPQAGGLQQLLDQARAMGLADTTAAGIAGAAGGTANGNGVEAGAAHANGLVKK
jgi:hypothetical protein